MALEVGALMAQVGGDCFCRSGSESPIAMSLAEAVVRDVGLDALIPDENAVSFAFAVDV